MHSGFNAGGSGYGGYGQAYYSSGPQDEQAYGEDLDWHEQREAEWLQRMQAQYFSRWSADKQNDWQAYQASFAAAQDVVATGSSEPQSLQGSGGAQSVPSREETRGAQEYRKQHEMKVISTFTGSVPTPVQSFEEASLPPQVFKEMKEAGFVSPTPIQAQCWPILNASHDIIGIAKSGSGKTLAFLGPAFARILRTGADVQRGPMALVLAPTRELARQIQLEALRFGRSSGILCCCCTGGESKAEQLEWLKRGCHVIVATPGRLKEFLGQRQVWLGQVNYLVLDEADRMLDMGFEPQIRSIIEECPRGADRQTLLFSATWPKAVRQLAFDFLTRPVHVHIGETNTAKANTDVTQHVVLLDGHDEKDRKLDDLLAQHLGEDDLGIIFVSTKRACQELANLLWNRKCGVTEIHGDKDQRERDWALREFTSKEKRVMVATDVASRGLDIKGVKLVINYDAANTPEDYVHRIGRTGRAGEKGISYTFLVKSDSADVKKAKQILEVMIAADQEIPEDLRQLVGFRGSKGGKGSGKSSKVFGKGSKGSKGSSKGRGKHEQSRVPPPGPLAALPPMHGGPKGGAVPPMYGGPKGGAVPPMYGGPKGGAVAPMYGGPKGGPFF